MQYTWKKAYLHLCNYRCVLTWFRKEPDDSPITHTAKLRKPKETINLELRFSAAQTSRDASRAKVSAQPHLILLHFTESRVSCTTFPRHVLTSRLSRFGNS